MPYIAGALVGVSGAESARVLLRADELDSSLDAVDASAAQQLRDLKTFIGGASLGAYGRSQSWTGGQVWPQRAAPGTEPVRTARDGPSRAARELAAPSVAQANYLGLARASLDPLSSLVRTHL